jgi:alkanesulfonate monooxygenase SsuD/methylene tetrahydromethanopterin reductase-like flavin-dependent oxidoreductase (luciferase family)
MRNPARWEQPWADFYEKRLTDIERAEELGIEAIWLSEHHRFPDGYLPQPLVMAAAIAARTSNVRVGTAILQAPLRSAQLIAEEAAIVDLLSGGRCELGLGVGYLTSEFVAYGVDYEQRIKLFRSRVQEVRRCWNEGLCQPAPLQERLPIWLGVTSPGGARFAGEQGEGLMWVDRELLRHYEDGLIKGGHGAAAARLSVHCQIFLAEEPAVALEALREHHLYQQASYRESASAESAEDIPPALREELLIWTEQERPAGSHGQPPSLHVLTPPQAVAFLREWLGDMPVKNLFFWDTVGGLSGSLQRQHVELLATELSPALKTLWS